jgi:hypothetical protein
VVEGEGGGGTENGERAGGEVDPRLEGGGEGRAQALLEAGIRLEVGQVDLFLQAAVADDPVGRGAAASQVLIGEGEGDDHTPRQAEAQVVRRLELVVHGSYGGNAHPSGREGLRVGVVAHREVQAAPAHGADQSPGPGGHARRLRRLARPRVAPDHLDLEAVSPGQRDGLGEVSGGQHDLRAHRRG